MSTSKEQFEALLSAREDEYVEFKVYTFVGERGVYTRKKGLDTEEKRSLVVKHLKEHGEGTIQEFEQMFPNLTRDQIYTLIKRLKKEGAIDRRGAKRDSVWFLKTNV